MIDETKSETEEQMDKTILSLEKKLQRIRTGRANPSLLESVEVDYYGSNTPISQMSNISVEDARTLSIVPWEKDQVQNIEKAIAGGVNAAHQRYCAGPGQRLQAPAGRGQERRRLCSRRDALSSRRCT